MVAEAEGVYFSLEWRWFRQKPLKLAFCQNLLCALSCQPCVVCICRRDQIKELEETFEVASLHLNPQAPELPTNPEAKRWASGLQRRSPESSDAEFAWKREPRPNVTAVHLIHSRVRGGDSLAKTRVGAAACPRSLFRLL